MIHVRADNDFQNFSHIYHRFGKYQSTLKTP